MNTELRSITDTRFFKYIDYLLLDDGEDPLFQVLRYLEGAIPKEELVRTFSLDESGSRVVYQDNPAYPASGKTRPDSWITRACRWTNTSPSWKWPTRCTSFGAMVAGIN